MSKAQQALAKLEEANKAYIDALAEVRALHEPDTICFDSMQEQLEEMELEFESEIIDIE